MKAVMTLYSSNVPLTQEFKEKETVRFTSEKRFVMDGKLILGVLDWGKVETDAVSGEDMLILYYRVKE